MKKFIGYILLTLVLVSCGAKSGHFRIKGRFRNFNQGEFYVYSPDGVIDGIDTIKVADGRFSYETELDKKATFMLIFPNFSEQPIFGESGATAEIKGDASHLREMEIKGTDDNEAMTNFRMLANKLTPPEVKKEAENFIRKNPTSVISTYLLREYFIESAQSEYAKAWELSAEIAKADKDNVKMAMLSKRLEELKAASEGGKLPSFSATDINGKSVGRKDLRAEINVIYTWSSWNYDSQNIQRELTKLIKKNEERMAMMAFCLDANKEQCKRFVEAGDSARWITVCDGKMWESPALKTLGLATVPGNIIADKNGKILAKNLSLEKMKEKMKNLLK